MSAPRVGVLVPSYNHGRFIGQALQSVLRQSYTDFSLTVVDDGSEDATGGVLQGLPQSVRVIRQAHAGIAATYNRGLREIEATYVAILESDDLWAEDYLARVVERMDADPQLAFLTTERRIIDEQGQPTGERVAKRTRGSRFTVEGILSHDWASVSTPVLRCAVLREIGPYDTRLAFGCDSEMALRVALRLRAGHLAEPLYLHRRHGQNTSADAVRTLEEVLRVLDRFVERHPRLPRAVRAAVRRRRGRTHARLGKLYLQDPAASRSLALGHLRRAAACTPLRLALYPRLLAAQLGSGRHRT